MPRLNLELNCPKRSITWLVLCFWLLQYNLISGTGSFAAYDNHQPASANSFIASSLDLEVFGYGPFVASEARTWNMDIDVSNFGTMDFVYGLDIDVDTEIQDCHNLTFAIKTNSELILEGEINELNLNNRRVDVDTNEVLQIEFESSFDIVSSCDIDFNFLAKQISNNNPAVGYSDLERFSFSIMPNQLRGDDAILSIEKFEEKTGPKLQKEPKQEIETEEKKEDEDVPHLSDSNIYQEERVNTEEGSKNLESLDDLKKDESSQEEKTEEQNNNEPDTDEMTGDGEESEIIIKETEESNQGVEIYVPMVKEEKIEIKNKNVIAQRKNENDGEIQILEAFFDVREVEVVEETEIPIEIISLESNEE